MTDFVASPQYQLTLAQLGEKLQSDLRLPVVIGLSGAQGSGKSTLAAQLVIWFKRKGVRAAAVSLDDYYLSKARRQQLSQDIHPLMAQRGVPGTHDIQQAIIDATAVLAGQPVALPQFDKALDDCLPDKPARQLDILIVEGWCIGVPPQTSAELNLPLNALEANEDAAGHWRRYVNAQLAGRYADYWRLLKPLIWLQAPDWDCVCRWRARQEQQLWRERGRGMTEAELARFMLPFQRLTQASWQQLATIANYTVQLDQQHMPALITADKR
jgi:D-glycerate 3-kinase